MNVVNGVGAPKAPRGRGRPRDEAIDEAVLDAAVALLLETDISSFTLLEVANRAGVPKSTVYRRWSSRREMLIAALQAALRPKLVPPDLGNLRADLIESMKLQMANFDTDGRPLSRIAMEVNDDPELSAIVTDAIAKRRRGFYPVLQRAIARGELRPDIDFDVVLDFIFGPIVSVMTARRTDVRPDIAERFVDQALLGLSPSA